MLFRVNPFEKMMVDVVVNQFTFMWAYTLCGEVGCGHEPYLIQLRNVFKN